MAQKRLTVAEVAAQVQAQGQAIGELAQGVQAILGHLNGAAPAASDTAAAAPARKRAGKAPASWRAQVLEQVRAGFEARDGKRVRKFGDGADILAGDAESGVVYQREGDGLVRWTQYRRSPDGTYGTGKQHTADIALLTALVEATAGK